jgi:hypothetical protein
MIRTESSATIAFTARSAMELSRDLKPGSIVRVTVLSVASDGTLRVRIGERTYSAARMRDMRPGESFDVRIRYSDNAVILTPVSSSPAEIRPDFFSSLGIPETPVSVYLVSFFRQINAKLSSETLRAIMKVASRFPGKELRAAEAAAILAERGIKIDDETVDRMVHIIEDGYGSAPDGDNRADENATDSDASDDGRTRDFCAFVNHKKGNELHWIVIPFRKVFSGQSCTGSVRFLLDTHKKETVETRVTFIESAHSWEFSINKGICSFTAEPGFTSVIFDKFVVYLMGLLEKTGITDVQWHESGQKPVLYTKSIDLEI